MFTIHYILLPIADILEPNCSVDLSMTLSESTSVGIRSALETVFISNGLELTFRQICTNHDNGSGMLWEFLGCQLQYC